MADTNVAITPGTGATVDARSQPGGDLRQVVTIGDGDTTPIAAVDAAGLQTRPGKSTTATPTRVAAATTSTQLLAVNTARLNASIYNDSTDTLYVKYGTGASATSKKFALLGGEYWEMPTAGTVYTGVIHGLWTGTNGAADVGEETA